MHPWQGGSQPNIFGRNGVVRGSWEMRPLALPPSAAPPRPLLLLRPDRRRPRPPSALRRPDGFTGASGSSPYGPGAAGPYGPSGSAGTFGLALASRPYLFAENIHLNFADFTLAAWLKIPDFAACGNDGAAGGPRVCTVGGRFSPIGSPLSGAVNEWYAFGYLVTVSDSGSPDGRFYAQVL